MKIFLFGLLYTIGIIPIGFMIHPILGWLAVAYISYMIIASIFFFFMQVEEIKHKVDSETTKVKAPTPLTEEELIKRYGPKAS